MTLFASNFRPGGLLTTCSNYNFFLLIVMSAEYSNRKIYFELQMPIKPGVAKHKTAICDSIQYVHVSSHGFNNYHT